jgi:hypothetical protein
MRVLRQMALVSLAFMPAIPAAAQVDALMLGLCRKVADGDARLKCYDAIGTTTEPSKPAELEIKPLEWNVVESKSPIDDSPEIRAGMMSVDGLSSIILRCAERKTEVVLTPRTLFVYDRGTVLVRLNDLPAASAVWPASTSHKALFAPNGLAFVKMLPDNGTLFVRATGQTASADATFKLGAVSAVRDRISAACRWQERVPTKSTAPK